VDLFLFSAEILVDQLNLLVSLALLSVVAFNLEELSSSSSADIFNIDSTDGEKVERGSGTDSFLVLAVTYDGTLRMKSFLHRKHRSFHLFQAECKLFAC
jgi:hypothetical protein